MTRVAFRTVAQPADEPVTLGELMTQVRVDGPDDQAILTGYLIAARQHVEAYLGRPILPTAMVGTLEAWPEDGRLLLDAPVLSVDGVTATGPDGQPAAWTGFVVRDAAGGAKWLRPAAGTAWPALGDDPVIRVDITAGWSRALLPESVKLAILQIAAHWYAVREVVNIGSITSPIPENGKDLLRGLRWRLIG